jgi:hypothetical protein
MTTKSKKRKRETTNGKSKGQMRGFFAPLRMTTF